MKKLDTTWRIFIAYLLVILFMLLALPSNAQITVKYFNAEWNKSNDIDWCHTEKKGLKDCEVILYYIGEDKESQTKYKIALKITYYNLIKNMGNTEIEKEETD